MMNEGSADKVLLERRSTFWPVIFLPNHERSHTLSVIGWKYNRPRVLRDVAVSFAGKVWLTKEHLRARSLLLGNLLSIKIRLDSIESVKVSEQDNGLIEIHYRQAEASGLLQFITKGAPKGIVLLKLDDAMDIWLQALVNRSKSP